VIDGRVLVQGAQPPEAFLQAFAQAGVKQAPAAGTGDSDGGMP
jgi:predicted DsbA family dithiol-disulfide isomerase